MLRTRLLLSFTLLIVLFGVLSLWFGIGLINDRVVAQAQDRVKLDLNSAWSIYNNRLRDVEVVLRMAAGLPDMQVDERLLAALEHGLPDCSGVAVGMDRVLMCAVGAGAIDAIIAFPLID